MGLNVFYMVGMIWFFKFSFKMFMCLLVFSLSCESLQGDLEMMWDF